MRTLRLLAAIGLLSLIVGGGLLIGALFPAVLRGPIALLTAKDEPTQADLVVVLSGNPVPRTLSARDLYARGLSRKILLIPGAPTPSPLLHELEKLGFKRSPSATPQRILMASGVPSSAIDQLPLHAENTKSESRLVGAYAAEHAVKSILLVTSPISSRRQCWIFKRALPTVRISCQPTSYEDIAYDRKLLLQVINEYIKIAANTVGIN